MAVGSFPNTMATGRSAERNTSMTAACAQQTRPHRMQNHTRAPSVNVPTECFYMILHDDNN